MAGETANTNQHYVPQLLLRGFTTAADTDQVYVFDKRTGKVFITSTRNIGSERGYYDLGGSVTLDSAMTRADGITGGIINRIRERQSLAGLSNEDRGMLAGFVVLQFLRTRGFQELTRHMAETVLARIEEMVGQVPREWNEELAPEKAKEDYLRTIPEFTKDFLPHLLNKDLLLYKTETKVPFCISDNPVALYNTVNPGDGIRGTIGFGVEGIEIYLPISSELTLSYICPSIGESLQSVNETLQRLGGFISEDAFYYLQARDTGKALKMIPDNVRFHNWLQVRYAERFIISSEENFADAADIIAQNPAARFGPRMGAR